MSGTSIFGISGSFLAFQSQVQQLTSLLTLFQPQSSASATSAQQSLFSGATGGTQSQSPQQALSSQISQLANNELTTLSQQNATEINTLSQNQTPGVSNPNANIIQFLNSQSTQISGQLTQNASNASPFSLLSSTTSLLLQQYALNQQEISKLNNGLDPALPSGNAAAVNVLTQQNATIISAISANVTALSQLPSFLSPAPPPAPPSQAVPFYFLPPSGSVLNLTA